MRISSTVSSSMQCSPIRPAFGNGEEEEKSKVDKLALVEKTADTVTMLKDENVDDEDKAKGLTELGKDLTKNMDPASPTKTVVTTGVFTVTGFLLGRKTLGPKVLGLLNRCSGAVDFLSKQMGKGIKHLKGIKVNNANSFNGFMTRTSKKFVTFFEGFAAKGLNAEELKAMKPAQRFTTIIKNGTEKAISTTGGVVGGGVAAAEILKDKDGNGQSDAMESIDQLSMIKKVEKVLDVAGAVSSLAG